MDGQKKRDYHEFCCSQKNLQIIPRKYLQESFSLYATGKILPKKTRLKKNILIVILHIQLSLSYLQKLSKNSNNKTIKHLANCYIIL